MTGSPGNSGGPVAGGPAGEPSGATPPTCYRHPSRETYIRCTRCGRSICPDCMIQAPVGFHCPMCVAEGAKSVRQARTSLGGEVVARPDLLTRSLIGVNIVVYVVGLAVGAGDLVGRLALFPLALVDGQVVGVWAGDWYRLLSAAFVHVQIWHIGLNMYALWVLGSLLEPVLGRWRFLTLYLLSALGGSVASLAFLQPGSASYGASGAVFGLMGATLVVLRRFGRDVTAVLVILGINVVLGFVVTGIDWRAHLGGLATGLLLSLAFAYAPRERRTLLGVLASVLVATVIVTVALVTTPALPPL